MGCDIHLYVERREGDKWVAADRFERDEDGSLNYAEYNELFYTERQLHEGNTL